MHEEHESMILIVVTLIVLIILAFTFARRPRGTIISPSKYLVKDGMRIESEYCRTDTVRDIREQQVKLCANNTSDMCSFLNQLWDRRLCWTYAQVWHLVK